MNAASLLNGLIAARLIELDKGKIRLTQGWLANWPGDGLSGGSARLKGLWGDRMIVGLTGNIAVGKSTVLALLRDLGASVIDADHLVHELRQPGKVGYKALVDWLGPEILSDDGQIDARQLSARAFAEPALLHRLEALFRPLVVAQAEHLARLARTPIVVIEAIKLLEGDLKACVDEVWVVDAPVEQQIGRLIETRGLTREQAMARIQAQNPQADKIAQADVVIHNSGTLLETHWQVLEAWGKALNRLFSARWGTQALLEEFVADSLKVAGADIPVADAVAGLETIAKACKESNSRALAYEQALVSLDSLLDQARPVS